MIHYLPGCDVRKNHPEAIAKLTAYMISKGAKIEECCRTKEQLSCEEEVIVHNCTMCHLILKEVQKGKVLSLYEYVLNDDTFPFFDFAGKRMYVQDCWRMKDEPQIHEAIRQCLEKMHIEVVEMEENKADSRFCGVWNLDHLTPIALELAPHHFGALEKEVVVLSEDEKEARMREHAKLFDEDVVCYCNGCERGLKMGNASVYHMVELLAKGLE